MSSLRPVIYIETRLHNNRSIRDHFFSLSFSFHRSPIAITKVFALSSSDLRLRVSLSYFHRVILSNVRNLKQSF